MSLRSDYLGRIEVLEAVSNRLEAEVRDRLLPDALIDDIQSRVKHIDRFLEKAARKNRDGTPKYPKPLNEIQDQIGLRVIVKFDKERRRIHNALKGYLHPVESALKQPDEPDQFGYEATHLVCLLPTGILDEDEVPIDFVELQVCTLFQHAWAEADHDVGYKPTKALTWDQQRLKSLAAAQAWGADRMFQELHDALQDSNPKG